MESQPGEPYLEQLSEDELVLLINQSVDMEDWATADEMQGRLEKVRAQISCTSVEDQLAIEEIRTI